MHKPGDPTVAVMGTRASSALTPLGCLISMRMELRKLKQIYSSASRRDPSVLPEKSHHPNVANIQRKIVGGNDEVPFIPESGNIMTRMSINNNRMQAHTCN